MDIASIGAAVALVKSIPGSAAQRAEAAAAQAAATAQSIEDSMDTIALLTDTGNLFDLSNAEWTAGNINTTEGETPLGAITSSTTFKYSAAFPVDGINPVLYLWRTAYESGNHYLRVGFYDGNGGPLDGAQLWGQTADGGQKTRSIPAGAASFRIAVPNADVESALTVAYTPLSGHLTYQQEAKPVVLDWAVGEALTTRVAAKAYVPGDYVLLGGLLYKVTAPIASGATITAASIALTAIADELSDPTAINISGTTATITARAGVRYLCGTMTELSFTPSASGLCEVVFTSGTTPTVLTLPQTVVMPDWWTGVEASRTYDIMIADGVRGAVMSWAT